MEHSNTAPAIMLPDVLFLKAKMLSLGWSFCYNVGLENERITYYLIKSDPSRSRNRTDILLEFGNIELAKAFAVLVEAGSKEKMISGSLDDAPTFDAYIDFSSRLGAHGCRVQGEIDFDRMAIGYSISVNGQSLIFNEWEAVEDFVQYLDTGAPRKAAVRPKTDQCLAKEGAAR